MTTALGFLARYEDLLPHREVITETEFQLQEVSGSHRPRIVSREDKLDKARARDGESNHWLQLADDQMVDNQTRGGPYLGYEGLRDTALAKLCDYVEVFRPSSLLEAELHYVDLVEIPIPPEGKIELQDYFHLRVEMPEVFGPTWYFSTRLNLQTSGAGDVALTFESVRPTIESNCYRFRLDWNHVCPNIDTLDVDTVRERLDRAHTCLLEYFRASVTDRTWALFQPSDEG